METELKKPIRLFLMIEAYGVPEWLLEEFKKDPMNAIAITSIKLAELFSKSLERVQQTVEEKGSAWMRVIITKEGMALKVGEIVKIEPGGEGPTGVVS